MSVTRNARRELHGVVTSTKAAKTITVEVTRTYKHPKYGKFLRKRTRYAAHDEVENAREGDTVVICATRPISKSKRWRLVTIVQRGDGGPTDSLAGVVSSPEEGGEA